MSLDLELSSRRALVTGGTKGVGAAVAELLRKQSAKVIAADITTAEGCATVAKTVLERLGARRSRVIRVFARTTNIVCGT
jgi:NAD(P)-dependent dehydrogenase (short-subunit alcohol dehydrogenase family)